MLASHINLSVRPIYYRDKSDKIEAKVQLAELVYF